MRSFTCARENVTYHLKLWNSWQCNSATRHEYLGKANCNPNTQQYYVAVAKKKQALLGSQNICLADN